MAPSQAGCHQYRGVTTGTRMPRLMAVVGASRGQDADAPRILPDIGDPLHLVCLRVDDIHRVIGRGGQIDLIAIRRRCRCLQSQIGADFQARDAVQMFACHRRRPPNPLG